MLMQVRHPVRHREERGDRADIPDLLVGETVLHARRVVVVDEVADSLATP
jgi:hypothetical protein